VVGGALVALVVLQTIEGQAEPPLRGITHAVNMAAAFGLGLLAYAGLTNVDGLLRLPGTLGITGLLMAVVLRSVPAAPGRKLGFVALGALVVTEVGLVLAEAPLPPLWYGGFLLLSLYVVSAASYAMLDRARRRAYVEIGVVTAATLVLSFLVTSRS
jgi:hypothetical protein